MSIQSSGSLLTKYSYGAVLVLLDLTELDVKECDSDFVKFLGMIGENYMPIGTALRMNRFELASGLIDEEIVALTGVITYLLMSIAELVVAEEALMNAQSPLLIEHWKRAYMFHPKNLSNLREFAICVVMLLIAIITKKVDEHFPCSPAFSEYKAGHFGQS